MSDKPAEKKGPAEVKGPATYVLKKPHYRDGTMHEAGSRITVVDEKPSKEWTRVHYDKKAPVLQKRLTPKEAKALEPAFDESAGFEETKAPEEPATSPAKGFFGKEKDDKGKRPNDKGI